MNWQAIAALATFAAVLVALYPIWREERRRRSHARSLRLRLCSKLALLRPSVGRVVQRGRAKFPEAILPKQEFQATIAAVANLLQESAVLQPEEQDALGVALANLETAGVLYDTDQFSPESAKNVLDLIDRGISMMGQHGLLHGRFEKPWES